MRLLQSGHEVKGQSIEEGREKRMEEGREERKVNEGERERERVHKYSGRQRI